METRKEGLANNTKPVEKGGFDQYCKILEAENPIMDLGADVQGKALK